MEVGTAERAGYFKPIVPITVPVMLALVCWGSVVMGVGTAERAGYFGAKVSITVPVMPALVCWDSVCDGSRHGGASRVL
ncbi:hypothetical protein LOC67_24350 [Stieleria sp. JC731]|uniref:hypothetical protein n=1 Tax=Pirellulaceae TaxID=2691357 RepID=UPI001E3DD9D9|nr:hypothetical protein [Stieleria sp. JC731]MCC9603693.1 hypothetical protein [Stieleria sp. JC731]